MHFHIDAPEVNITGLIDDIVDEGIAINLTCAAYVNGPVNISWAKVGSDDVLNSTKVNQHSIALEFEAVHRSDNGSYICHAVTDLGESDKEEIKIKVRGMYWI